MPCVGERAMKSFFENRRVLVTGACGTVGVELVRLLLEEYQVRELVGLDNNESELFFLEQRFAHNGHARFFLGDVRDRDKLCRKMERRIGEFEGHIQEGRARTSASPADARTR